MENDRQHCRTENDRANTKELHVAPMLNVSTIEFRNFMRVLTKRCVIWTEMVVDETIHYNLEKTFISEYHDIDILKCSVSEHLLPFVLEHDHPIVCQVGGMRPDWTRSAAKAILEAGYNQGEINLNLDCPSSRVQGKQFGAVLLRDVPRTIGLLEAIREIATSYNVPVSVKCRIGIVEDETDLKWIIQLVKELSSVCTRFILHARAVALHGLSPAKNRSVPPLNYPWVYKLCDTFPQCDFIINGGLSDLRDAKDVCYGVTPLLSNQPHTVPCDICNHPCKNGSCIAPPSRPAPINLRGCMIGRAAIENPLQFAIADRYWYGIDSPSADFLTRRLVVEEYCRYLDRTYPRRCCDSDHSIVTHELPVPSVSLTYPYCSVCKEFRVALFCDASRDEIEVKLPPMNAAQSCLKIATRIIDRSLKPVLGLFYKQNGSKLFRRQCDVLSRDPTARNCGPAFILYQAVTISISCQVLDKCILEEFSSFYDLTL
jgi:tRNA-dihydrouridine synthase A